jgi:hypothetical protein
MLKLKKFGDSTWFSTDVGDWRVDYQMRVDTEGALVVSRVQIAPRAWFGKTDEALALDKLRFAPRGGISPELLRRLRMGAEARFARNAITTQSLDPPKASEPQRDGRGRPPTLTTAFYRRVAARYNDLVKARAKDPNKILEREFEYSQTGMASVIYRCRRKGLIRPSGRGPRR